MYEPISHLGRLLSVLVQQVGAMQPMAFKEIDVSAALEQADNFAKQEFKRARIEPLQPQSQTEASPKSDSQDRGV